MRDTNDFMQKKQYEIFMAKPLKERVLLNLELSEWVWKQIFLRLQRRYPDLPEAEIKILRIKECYGKDFTSEQLDQISEAMRAYYKNKNTHSNPAKTV